MPIKHAAAITKRIPTILESVSNTHHRFFSQSTDLQITVILIAAALKLIIN